MQVCGWCAGGYGWEYGEGYGWGGGGGEVDWEGVMGMEMEEVVLVVGIIPTVPTVASLWQLETCILHQAKMQCTSRVYLCNMEVYTSIMQ